MAVAAGLLVGAAMRPQLVSGDGPAGPQILAGSSGARSVGPLDDGLAYASYSGEIPEHVLGTDWRRLAALPVAALEPAQGYWAEDHTGEDYASRDDYEPPAYDDLPRPAEPQPARYADASTRALFPSLDGGAAYEDVSRAEKTPLASPRPVAQEPHDIDPEAPPEATGDTTVDR